MLEMPIGVTGRPAWGGKRMIGRQEAGLELAGVEHPSQLAKAQKKMMASLYGFGAMHVWAWYGFPHMRPGMAETVMNSIHLLPR